VAFPTTSVLDNFNRANGALGADWSTLGGTSGQPSIVSNAVSSTTDYTGAWWDTSSFGPDSEVFISCPTAGDPYWGLFARLADPGGSYDGYQASWASNGTGNLTLQRLDNGVQTPLGSAVTLSKANGDKLGLEVTGTSPNITVRCYTDTGSGWTQRIEVTGETSYSAAGFLGFDRYDPGDGGNLDDFGGGTVVAAAAAIPSLVMAPPVAA
jgi:hypothetical protein